MIQLRLAKYASPHDLRDYYKRAEGNAAVQLVALPDGIEKQSAEETWVYMRGQHYKYAALCANVKP